jgi:hypothetical protein
MTALSSKSREHRMRVLANQSKAAAAAQTVDPTADPQLKIPLIGEVKPSTNATQQKRRAPRAHKTKQAELEGL